MLSFLNLKPKAFGLDISDLSLKIIKLEKKGNGLELACFGETMIQPGIVDKGEINDKKTLVKIIKQALLQVQGEKLKTRHVIASLPEEKAFLQVIKLPLMADEEAKKAVYFEAENYIPLAIKDVYLDSQIILRLPEQKQLYVLIAALPKKIVDPYIDVLKGAGLKPLSLEIESQAICWALIKNNKSLKPVLLIDLGATRTSFIIFSGSSLRFTAFCPISSQQFTAALAKGLKIDLEQAEILKIKHGVGGDKEGKQNFKILNPYLNDLADRIKKCLTYHQNYTVQEQHLLDGHQIDKVLLCGGGANLKGLIDFLSIKLNLPVEMGNPWINILAKQPQAVAGLSYQESIRYTTALGLALKGTREV